MKTSATEPCAAADEGPDPGSSSSTRAGEARPLAAARRRRRRRPRRRRDAIPGACAKPMLAVPGDQVAVHWLELDEAIWRAAQAAAAARLMLADASAEPLSEMHVAVGRAERGLTPARLVPGAGWRAGSRRRRRPGSIRTRSFPSRCCWRRRRTGFVRAIGAGADLSRSCGGVQPRARARRPADRRSGGRDDRRGEFEADLGVRLAAPPLNLRQGPFARRRQWKVESAAAPDRAARHRAGRCRLVVQVAAILRYTFAADRIEAEASALAADARSGGIGPPARASPRSRRCCSRRSAPRPMSS